MSGFKSLQKQRTKWRKRTFASREQRMKLCSVSKWEKGRDRFFLPNCAATVTALPAHATSVWGGQVGSWQAVSGPVSLQKERRSKAKPSGRQPALPAEEPTLHVGSHGESGSHWGVGLSTWVPHPFRALGRSVGGWMTLTGFNCQLASKCIGKERWLRPWGEGEEWKWMTRG